MDTSYFNPSMALTQWLLQFVIA